MEKTMSTWGPRIFRAFGVMNILFALFGVCVVAGTAVTVVGRLGGQAGLSYLPTAYYLMTLANLGFLVGLAVAGVYLLRLDRRGLRISNIVFLAEIAWFAGNVALAVSLGMLGQRWAALENAVSGAAGIGDVGLALQYISGYPLIGLVVLNLVRRGLPATVTHT